MPYKLIVQNLYKSFGNQPVLRGVSLRANSGNVIALLGSSGSGKSTLLRCINLLTTPDTGILKIDEQELKFNSASPHPLSRTDITKLRKRVGMVFQQFNLWAHKTIVQNLIEAPIHVLRQPKADAILRAHQMLQKVGLADKCDQYPAQLSGGQQQRAAIARALMMQPEIMLFDEPTSALDPERINEVLSVMQALAAEGMTMLIASHELGFARRVASHTIFLHEGMITEEGETREMFNHPKTERFQQFLKAVQHE